MIHAADMGKDYEHCQAIQKRLDDAETVTLLLTLCDAEARI